MSQNFLIFNEINTFNFISLVHRLALTVYEHIVSFNNYQ